MHKKITSLLMMTFLILVSIQFNQSHAQEEVPFGPWIDSIEFSAEPDFAKAVDKLENEDLHLYLSGISDPDLIETIQASPSLKYMGVYNQFYEVAFNPVGPILNTGEFNPFSNPKIREAINYLVDRKYVADEICQGLATPKFVPIVSSFIEYGRLAGTINLLEAEYSHDFEKAKEIIFEELGGMGVEFKDDKWYYNDTAITLKLLIRTEYYLKEVGDYIGDLFEELGFATERIYKSVSDFLAIGFFPDPADGQWHAWISAWSSTVISRDDSGRFAFFYTPLGIPLPLWQSYKPEPTFFEVSSKLSRGEWSTWDERMELMRRALPLSLEDSARIWLVDTVLPYALRQEVEVAVDLAGAFINPMWAKTVRFSDQVGGVLKAANKDILVNPWNPIEETYTADDAPIVRSFIDYVLDTNPYTGLPMPNRFQEVNMEIEEGEQVTSSSDWLTLTFVDEITVPSGAWVDWNSETSEVVTASPGTTAKAKVSVNYGDILGEVKFHDGSVMSMADWVGLWPLNFERGNPDSLLYDESVVTKIETWKMDFVGMRIVSEEPLVIEYYTNYIRQEAEFVADWAMTWTALPWHGAGTWPTVPWHVYAPGIRAEERNELAFTRDKADAKEIEWMSYIGGPSLDILEDVLNEIVDTSYLPFEEHLSNYVTTEEALERYQKLQNWFLEKGHFFVATGPYYLDSVDFTAKSAVVKAFREYPFKADRFAWLAEPPIPELSLQTVDNVVPGLETVFNLTVSYAGTPYPNDKIEFVKYFVLDSAAKVFASGDAVARADGEWEIRLTDVETSKMAAGVYEIRSICLSKDVGTPKILDTAFTVIPELSYLQSVIASNRLELESEIDEMQLALSEAQNTITELEGAINSFRSITWASIGISIVAILIVIYFNLISKRS